MLIINDVHIGFQRKGGTTPSSAEALRSYLFQSLGRLLEETEETHLLIAGDLFDDFDIPARDWVETFNLLAGTLAGRLDMRLTLVAGNHDHSPKAERVSSFQMLCQVMRSMFERRVTVIGIDEWDPLEGGSVVALAHCSNQAIFDEKLIELLDFVRSGHRVILHANYDNNFTVESDHSLNVSREMAKRFASEGATLYFAHVHQAKTDLGGSVVVMGNQWPTSVADCLGNDDKFAHVFNGGVTKIRTWDYAEEENGFTQVDWQDLDKPIVKCSFLRVTGKATAAQASEVVNAIAKFRQIASCFVITNAVKVEGIPDNDTLPDQFEAAKRFDVMAYIKQHLEPAEEAAVDVLMKDLQ